MNLESYNYFVLSLEPDEMVAVKEYFERQHKELGKAGFKGVSKKDRAVIEMFIEEFNKPAEK